MLIVRIDCTIDEKGQDCPSGNDGASVEKFSGRKLKNLTEEEELIIGVSFLSV